MTSWPTTGDVLRVHDGDTPILAVTLADVPWLGIHATWTTRVRVARINAPELATPGGAAARDYAAALLPIGERTQLVIHGLDNYGRPLADITLPDGRDFGALMVAAGRAQPYRSVTAQGLVLQPAAP